MLSDAYKYRRSSKYCGALLFRTLCSYVFLFTPFPQKSMQPLIFPPAFLQLLVLFPQFLAPLFQLSVNYLQFQATGLQLLIPL